MSTFTKKVEGIEQLFTVETDDPAEAVTLRGQGWKETPAGGGKAPADKAGKDVKGSAAVVGAAPAKPAAGSKPAVGRQD